MATATFGAGCFWGVEEAFRQVEGVTGTSVGYMGGTREHPSYEQVCTGRTGHAEVVQVDYDPERVSYDALLAVFWGVHDPTQVNRQGPDFGTQYRTVIFTRGEDQDAAAKASLAAEQARGRHRGDIATQIVPASSYWIAEDYHQQYFAKRGRGRRFGLF